MQENTNQLAVQQKKAPVAATKHGLQFSSLDDMWRFAVAMCNGGEFKDIKTPEQALLRLQAGMELGLTPVWSLANIMVTNGRPAVWGDALRGIVLTQPDCSDVIERTEGEGDTLTAICEIHRKGRTPVVRKFSVSDAKSAGLWRKAGPWTNYAGRMLQMRAFSWAARDAYADKLRGLGVKEELQDIPQTKQANAREVTGLVLPDEVPSVESARTETAEEATLL